jgi:hypothetical protein
VRPLLAGNTDHPPSRFAGQRYYASFRCWKAGVKISAALSAPEDGWRMMVSAGSL